MMTAQTFIVNKKTMSLLDIVDMDDPGNILIGNISMARWLFQLLHSRILNEAGPKTNIHMHLPASNLAEVLTIDYKTLAVLGANIYLWMTSLPTSIDTNVNYVVIPDDSFLAQQTFLIIDSIAYTRALFIWENTETIKQGDYSIIGALVTNPTLARRLCQQMDAIVNQAKP